MHGILSLAALHLAYTEPTNKMQYTLAATRHHNEALQGFRDSMNETTDENSDALFACATLNWIYVFRTLGRHHDHVGHRSRSSHTSRVLGAEWIPLICGAEVVLQPVYERVRLGPLGAMLDMGDWEQLDPDGGTVAEDHHFREIRASWAESGHAQVYDDAICILRKCNMYLRLYAVPGAEPLEKWGWNREWAGPLKFLFFAPKAFFSLLRQRQPPALLIFAYFGVLLHYSNEHWFLEGWGQDIVEVVDDILGDYWKPWMAWPIEVIR